MNLTTREGDTLMHVDEPKSAALLVFAALAVLAVLRKGFGGVNVTVGH